MQNMLKLTRLSILCLLATLSISAQARDISMVTVNWQPYYGDGLDNGGVLTELTQTAFARKGHNSSIEFMPWSRALKLVEEGSNDVIMGAYFNEERNQKYLFSFPFYKVSVGLIARKDSGLSAFNTLDDLRPYRIGVSRGFANSEEFDAADFLNKDVGKNPAINLLKLERNRIDAMAGAFGIFRYEASQAELSLDDFVFVDPPLDENFLYLMVSKNIPDGEQLVRDFNAGMLELLEDGTLKRILRKYGF